jgi:hypothetical protein
VDKKKPDPKIYNVAAQRLGVDPAECVVVEDSTIGLQAALGAGMRCIITYTPSTKQQVSLPGSCVTESILQAVYAIELLRLWAWLLVFNTAALLRESLSVQVCTWHCKRHFSKHNVNSAFAAPRTTAACMQAFDGAEIIVHELGNNVSLRELMERPAAVRDDRQGASARLVSSSSSW